MNNINVTFNLITFLETGECNINIDGYVRGARVRFRKRWVMKLETLMINMDVFLVAELYSYKDKEKY